MVRILDIELTNHCNINCTICPRDEITRPFGYMTADTYNTLLAKIKRYSIQHVGISGFGEPLLHPLFPKFIKQLRKGFQGNIQIVTNASRLTAEIADAIIEARVDGLVVSYNGPGKEEYEKVMRGMRFNKLERHVKSFIKKRNDKKKPTLVLQTSMPDALEHKTIVMKIAADLGFEKLNIYPFNNRMGYLKHENDNVNHIPLLNRFCYPFLFVAWDGNIYPCSHDIKGLNVLGSILDIEFDKVVKEDYAICASCTICDNKGLKSYNVYYPGPAAEQKFGAIERQRTPYPK